MTCLIKKKLLSSFNSQRSFRLFSSLAIQSLDFCILHSCQNVCLIFKFPPTRHVLLVTCPLNLVEMIKRPYFTQIAFRPTNFFSSGTHKIIYNLNSLLCRDTHAHCIMSYESLNILILTT